MMKEMAILMVNSLVASVITSMVVAPLLVLAARRLAGIKVGFMRGYIAVVLVEVSAAWVQIVGVMVLGFYLPLLTNHWASWLLQALTLLAAGWLLLPLLLRPVRDSRLAPGQKITLCLTLMVMVMVKNAAMLYIYLTFFYKPIPGV